jgi:hypothetical protein
MSPIRSLERNVINREFVRGSQRQLDKIQSAAC